MSNKRAFIVLLPMLLVLFIDDLGQGIFFPILTKALTNPNSTVLVIGDSPEMRSLLYGLIISVFFICWFFGAPILSDFSDRYGRKKHY